MICDSQRGLFPRIMPFLDSLLIALSSRRQRTRKLHCSKPCWPVADQRSPEFQTTESATVTVSLWTRIPAPGVNHE